MTNEELADALDQRSSFPPEDSSYNPTTMSIMREAARRLREQGERIWQSHWRPGRSGSWEDITEDRAQVLSVSLSHEYEVRTLILLPQEPESDE